MLQNRLDRLWHVYQFNVGHVTVRKLRMVTLFWEAASAMVPFTCPEMLPLLDIWPNNVGPKTIAIF